jgi:hypothetical protein
MQCVVLWHSHPRWPMHEFMTKVYSIFQDSGASEYFLSPLVQETHHSCSGNLVVMTWEIKQKERMKEANGLFWNLPTWLQSMQKSSVTRSSRYRGLEKPDVAPTFTDLFLYTFTKPCMHRELASHIF